MCVDNICWIGASPEYVDYKHYTFKKKVKYILKDRVLVVLTHPRDILPAILTSAILGVIF